VTTISTLPPAPQPTDDKATFNAKAFAMLAALPTFVTEANAQAGENNTAAGTATSGAATATTKAAEAQGYRDAAATSASDAAAAAGAVAWVSGTTYAVGDRRRSLLDGRVYRRTLAGAGTTDPANDTANWVDQVVGARVRITSATNLQVRTLYELDSSGGAFNVTLPATFGDTDWIDFVDVGLALGVSPVTVLRNGNNIRRVAEDLILDVAGDSLRLTARTSLGWIEQ